MTKRTWLSALAVATLVTSTGAVPAAQSPTSTVTVEGIRRELLKLPYYGVFDYIAFGYDKGTVTLAGYVYRLGLKSDAERAVKRAAGVDTVVNNLEELPVSSYDDDIRWRTYYAIYTDPFLSRYVPGGGVLWGHGHHHHHPHYAMGGPRFMGMEPAGDYPIRIIVKGSRITLLGVVENEADKNVAGIRASGVSGTFGVDNQLVVESK
jgi:hyperosmotically inducible protein